MTDGNPAAPPAAPPSEEHSSVVGEILGDVSTRRRRPDPCSIVIFGAAGDLTGRKLAPALFNLMLDKALAEPTIIIGVSRGAMPASAFADKLKGPVATHSRQKVEPAQWDRFASMLDFVGGEFADDATYLALKARLEAAAGKGTRGNRVFYLSTPPAVFPLILQKLQQHGLIERKQQRGDGPA